MNQKKGSLTRIIVIGAVFLLLASMLGINTATNYHPPLSVSSLGYSSAFQGPKVEFYGIDYNGAHYTTAAAPNSSSLHEFDTVMHFDPDGSSSGKPKIQGEMTTIFLPEESLTVVPSWLPMSWLQNNGLVHNPQAVYNWTIGKDTYDMEQYSMRYYVSLSSDWAGTEDPANKLDGIITTRATNVLNSVNIWLKFDISPTWYIQGGGTAYFAIAKCQLAEDAIMKAKDNNGVQYSARTAESVSPESRYSPVELYYGAWGGQAASANPQTYMGQQLNPSYFRNELYAHVDLNNFGVEAGSVNVFGSWTHGDVVTFAFDVTVFIIGDYQVKDIQNNPTQYGRFTPVSNSDTFFSQILGWLLNPVNFSILLIIAVVVLLIIFAPWVLALIVTAIFGGRKK